ncbi:MAG: hypothetical protein ABSB67_09455 [Bryobacteraceae bacterium]
MIRGFNRTWSMAAGVFVFLGLAALGQAQDCSNSAWTGTSYYLSSGTALTPEDVRVPDVQLGELTADGNGNVTGQVTESADGTIESSTIKGTYTVTGACNGSQTLTITPTGSPSTISYSAFQLVSSGTQLLIATTNPGVNLTGQAYAAAVQSPSACGQGSLVGSYGFQGSSPALGLASPYSFSGQVMFDGNGGLRFALTLNDQNPGFSGTSSLTGTGVYTVATDCSGTASFGLQTAVTANYSFAIVQGGTVLFLETDPGTLFYGTWQPDTAPMVLPQFAFGGGWYSALYFTNTTNVAVSFPVNFVADNGTALRVSAIGSTSVTVSIPGGGTAIVEAPNSTQTLAEGYAWFTLPPGVSGYGVFRQSVTGKPDQEAVAPFEAGNVASSTMVWDDTKYVTSVAIVNSGATAGTVSITLWNNDGNTVGTSSISLGAHQKTEAALRTLQGLSTMAGQRGRARFVTSEGTIAVLGLRFDGTAFTSIPVQQ